MSASSAFSMLQSRTKLSKVPAHAEGATTSRLVRPGKARVAAEVTALLDRLRLTWDTWQQTLTQLFTRPKLLGVAFSFDRSRLRAAAARRGCRHLANLNGCRA